ncbi:MAG TPA: hypothetical protein VNN73_21815 [Blastocatellia bacterium]|nr:hypothetical protein [Blastocatellia bacterium]
MKPYQLIIVLLVAFSLGTSGHISDAAKDTKGTQSVTSNVEKTSAASSDRAGRSDGLVNVQAFSGEDQASPGAPAAASLERADWSASPLKIIKKPLYRREIHALMASSYLMPKVFSVVASASRSGFATGNPAVFSPQALTTPSFEPLGLGPGGVQSRAWDVSADGSVVVGTFWAQNGSFTPPHAYRWTAGIFEDLGSLNPNAQEAEAYAVSDDGSKVVGWARGLSGFQRPFLWTAATGMQELSNVPGSDAKATDISHDGSVIVGSFYVDAEGSWHAFKWTNGVVTDLGFLPGGRDSKGQAVCGPGTAVVGSTVDSVFIQRAFRWRSGSMQNLGAVGKNQLAYAEDCSDDGSVVVGTSMDDKGNQLATRWDTAGVRSLGTLGGNMSESHASSADGSIVVGGAGLPFVNGISEFSAFRWNRATGKMEQLSRVLQSLGVNNVQFCNQIPCPAGTWFLQFALGISPDGSVIVGDAVDPSGKLQAFRAVVPTGGGAVGGGGGGGGTTDTVSVQRAEYTMSKRELRVEATSTSASATLQVFVTSTGQLIGTLANNGGGKYSATFTWPSNPQSITVKSSLGGSATKTVTAK